MKRSVFFASFVVLYAVLFLFRFPLFAPFLLFMTGLILGYYFHVFDRVVQVFALEELSAQKEQFVSHVQQGRVFAAFSNLLLSVEPISNSFYFLALYVPLALFMISSTGSVIGSGLVLGLGLSYVAHFIWGRENIAQLREAHFHLLKKSVTDQQIKMLMGIFILLFVVLSLLVFVRG